MLRRAPLKAKRDKPRRNEGRVQHKRMKPKATGKTAEEARFLDLVASLGCLICGSPASVHHIMHCAGKLKRRDHRFVVPLCQRHHQGMGGVHDLGGEAQFRDHWGVDLVGWAMEAWSYREHPQAAFWHDSVTRCRGIAMKRLYAHKGRAGSAKDEQSASTGPNPSA
jgi:hypothetical protein